MTSPPPSPARRLPRSVGAVLLRVAGLTACAAVVPLVSDETDGLALGLTVFLLLAAGAFVAALIDAIRTDHRLRSCLVWAAVVPLLALLRVADYVRGLLTGPGGYPDLAAALASPAGSWAELSGSFVFHLVLVGVPAAAGTGVGLLLRLLTPAAAEHPSGTSGPAPYESRPPR